MASADSTRIQSASGGSSVSGKRSTNPSSPHSVSTSGPPAARMRALTAIAQGMWMRLPNGVSTHTRQSPSSSRQRSTTMVRSSGTWPVASAWSARKRSRFSAAPGSRSCSFTRRVSAAACGNARSSRTMAPMRRPNSSGRPGPSPFQNGILPGSPGAGVTSTRSCVMSVMRHVDAPRMNVSLGCDSKTISSSSSPTRTGLPSVKARKTP